MTQGNGTVVVNNSAAVRVFTKMISNVHSSKVYLSHAGHGCVYPEIPCINTSTSTPHGGPEATS